MRVIEARMQRVRLPLVHEFQTSSHRKTHLEHILVRLRADDGSTAWGEIASPSAPYYGAETVDTCWGIAEDYLLPALVGAEWSTPAEASASWSRVRGNYFAKAGVDAAVWSLYAAMEGIPLSRALGGRAPEVVAGVSLGIEPTIEDLLVQVRAQVDHGYPRVKLKITPGWDVEPVRAVRDEFPLLDLHVDANAAYSRDSEHMDALRALDDYSLTMIEQPFDARDFLAHAALQKQVSTPVCLDESVETVADLETALRLDAGRVINIKVSRMGGLTPAVAAHDIALAAGVPVWCGGMHEFGVGRAANIALASLPGFTLPSDVSGSDKYYARDVTTEPILADHGVVAVPTSAGLGVEVDEEWVAANTVRTAVVTRQ
jgi:o-succinylbenzoate synthase